MHGKDNVAIQNLHGRLTQALTARRYGDLAPLFLPEGVYEAPDDGVALRGRETIAAHFAEKAQADGPREWFLSHTPAIAVDAGGETARGTWYVSTVSLEEGGVVQGSARFDADLQKAEGRWYYRRLQFYYMMTLLPQPGGRVSSEDFPPPPAEGEAVDPTDFVDLQRLVGRWSHDRRKNFPHDFAAGAPLTVEVPDLIACAQVDRAELARALDRTAELEGRNFPYPLTVPMLTSPVIQTEGDQASGTWLVLRHDAAGPAFRTDGYAVRHRLEGLRGEFVREAGEWKIVSLVFTPLMELPESPLDVEASKGTMSGMEEPWLDAPEPGRRDAAAAEEVLALEEYITFWVSGLRYRSEAPFYYQRWALERPELLEYCVGPKPQRLKRGLEDITEAIFAMVSKFSTLQPKGPGNHTGTTPVIEVSEDGQRARAVWLDYGWTTAAEVFGITKPPYFANPAVARYEHRYIKLDGKWKLYSFQWLPFYRLDKWTFDYARTKGWSGTTSTRRFPLPREEYVYEDDPAKRGQKVVLDPPAVACPYEKPWTGETDKL